MDPDPRKDARMLSIEESVGHTLSPRSPTLETSDIQATVLRPRPKPYCGEYVVLRVGNAEQGREMLRRILPHVARAAILHDFGANAPANWEYPFGTPDVHVALAIYAQNEHNLQQMLELALKAHHDLPQISVVYRMPFGELPEGRNPFGFKDGLHNPPVEGSGPAGQAGIEQTIKAGEFVLGYPDERGETANAPIPAELRRNGTFVAIRKFHMDVAAFRRYLRAQASSPEEEE